jgi:hypothetical protein
MSTKPAPSVSAPPPPEAVPTTHYERFLAALPDTFRKECQSKLKDSGLAANHPAFLALAELYEKERENPPRDFYEEAALHANLSSQLFNQLNELPGAIMAKIDPQLHGLLSALNAPLERLEAVTKALESPAKVPQAHVSAEPPPIPIAPPSNPEKKEKHFGKALGQFFCTAGSTLGNPVAWMVTGSISVTCAVTILFLGAAHLSRSYEAAYQDRVAHMEADSATDTVALNRLLIAGITLQVQRAPDGTGWYLILPGARRAAKPVNSPEGLAVEVWP